MDIEQALELEAGRELDRVVAEALGWTNIEETTYWIDDYDGSEEITAWEGVPPDTHSTRLVPRYSTDANAALSLPREEGVALELALYSNSAAARFSIPVSSRSAEAFPEWQAADTPALAIVRAWLAYRKADTP